MTIVAGAGAGAGAGVSGAALLKDLKKQVTALEDDLRERTGSVEEFRAGLEAEYARAREGKRTAATYGAWRDERVTQAAAAWVLGCVFVRFCEDNRLIEWPFLAGPKDRLRDAEERHEAFFREKPHLNNRDWLEAAFQHLADSNETAAGLFDHAHNPLWGLTPSYEAATDLLSFWRRRGADGEILYDFTDPEWDTRFLGDLYQDLSEHARKTYALLQTPEFVEEFILDLTLEPAIEEFGLAPEGGLRTIDPACGSGHFLLGIFGRLVEKWRAAEPGTDEWALVRRALESVHGCDKNPFAASIARFRLLVAAMKEAGARRLAEAPVFPINVAVGDSLLHGRGAAGIQTDLDTLFAEEEGDGEAFQYSTEDVGEFAARVDLLGRGSYHVVVGNPPYIEVSDRREKENYKAAYSACSGLWVLTVPFAQRLFDLAIRSAGSTRDGGYVGQITGNNFMKREFGKKLITEFFPSVDLTHVIDTSCALIPGHSTPTVTLVGRNRLGRQSDVIRVVQGIRQESAIPDGEQFGPAWRAIKAQVDSPGSESEWVSVADVDRHAMVDHPWSLQGGGASELLSHIDKMADRLTRYVKRVGFFGDSHADEAFAIPPTGPLARKAEALRARKSHRGDQARDWRFSRSDLMIYPYDEDKRLLPLDRLGEYFARHFWPWRTELWCRSAFGGGTYADAGRQWYEWHQLPKDESAHPFAIAFAEVATHNHFVMDRAGVVFNRTAPVVKLRESVSEERHIALWAILNSSVACFWLKQVCQCKGNATASSGMADQPWSWNYQFSGTKVSKLPLPVKVPNQAGCAVDALCRELGECEPVAQCETVPTRTALAKARSRSESILGLLIAWQEELDWEVYGSYGLLANQELPSVTVPLRVSTSVPEVHLGERAFEIVLARKVAAGEIETAWFERHGSNPVTEIPDRWPDWYRDIVQARIEIINSRKDIALIERPECKRRWAGDSWEKKEKAALRTWLLDRIEEPSLWYALRDGIKQPRTLTVSQLADALRDDTDFNSVAQLYAADHMGKPDLPLAHVLAEVIDAEHVPYLAALRYKDSGLRNREQWEQVWELQREEDRTGQRLDIPVPPKYKGSDFLKQSYWSNRGKLDVPKERFISYLGASPDADPTVLLGWAGWDHKDQAQALFNLVDDRTKQAGWDTDRIKPLLAGLLEVMPWVRQWHGDYDEDWEGVPADEYQAYFEELCAKHQVSESDLRAWRPEKTRAKKKTAPKAKVSAEQPALGE
ncbi:BREX-2 system adenine-specific DNA-methyltransferase PglX [Streptomyces sp. SID12488]|uniref:BREX-2 system adenine-specific DNA-methyltransferase PglX n=1 Tax=Streptomyces sp. SID12488 TaxID=2706040 RepID=UPI0031BB7827